MCLLKDVLNITLDLDQVLHKRALSYYFYWWDVDGVGREIGAKRLKAKTKIKRKVSCTRADLL